MKMTINEMIKAKGMSRYSLSKNSGIPWVTISDICSGKKSLARCSTQTVQKLSAALGITELQKDFYKVMLAERKTKILDYGMELLQAHK